MKSFWDLYWDAFEDWIHKNGIIGTNWVDDLSNVIENLLHGVENRKLKDIVAPQFAALKQQLQLFQSSLLDKPTGILWLNFLEMTGILKRFIFHQREGNWIENLSESSQMLAFLVAAGHYKYEQQSVPLYLNEMKNLQTNAPAVHQAFMEGGFVGRRSAGSHNGVPADMFL